MTWWLPSTWFEDTGKLRRVSPYCLQEENLSHDGLGTMFMRHEATATFRDTNGKSIDLTYITNPEKNEGYFGAIEGCKRKAREYKSD